MTEKTQIEFSKIGENYTQHKGIIILGPKEIEKYKLFFDYVDRNELSDYVMIDLSKKTNHQFTRECNAATKLLVFTHFDGQTLFGELMSIITGGVLANPKYKEMTRIFPDVIVICEDTFKAKDLDGSPSFARRFDFISLFKTA